MSPERWKQVEKLYQSALEQPNERRGAFLGQACEADDELRREVEALLRQDEADGLLDRPAWDGESASTPASLVPGAMLGPYRIEAYLGAGGMGSVYRGVDTRLGRPVAIKLPGRQFSERFHKEARAIAALNHPHVCTLYDVGPDYLVMEFVEGQTLADRLRIGSMPLDQALRYGMQIADALAAAHSRGIVHRDLKPANIMITAAGVKLLDFGLAKKIPPAAAATDAAGTVTITEPGTVIGTPGYMAPEQVEGKESDARTDIFAFGAVLYELIMGRKAFEGKSAASVMAAVMKDQPPPSAQLAGPIEPVLRRCLAKNPDERWQSAADLSWALRQVSAERPVPGTSRVLWWSMAAATAVLLAIATIVFTFSSRRLATEPETLRFSIEAPPDTQFAHAHTNNNSVFGNSAISPDGRLLVFTASHAGGTDSFWLRPLDSLAARELPGTLGATLPFWSPDSKSIGFFADGKLKRIELSGGSAQALCDAPGPAWGASWSRDGVILFSADNLIRRVAATGGDAVTVTILNASRLENAHRWPHILPDGRRFLYHIRSSEPNRTGIYAGELDRPDERLRIVGTDWKGIYAPPIADRPGYLLSLRDETLMAQPFDAVRLRLDGDPVPVAHEVALASDASGRAAFWASDTGVLAYRTGGLGKSRMAWISRDGKRLEAPSAEDRYFSPRLSPDGRQVAFGRNVSGNFDIWQYEFSRGVTTRVSVDPGRETLPVWSPDGRQVAFSAERGAERGGTSQLYRMTPSGGGQEERLTEGPYLKNLLDWSRDGRYLLYQEVNLSTTDLMALPLEGARRPMPLVTTRFGENHGQFSPDGKWIAYDSNQSGRSEVYVQAFPSSTGRWQVSNTGGTQPRWRGDGRELFYLSGGRMMMAAIEAGRSGVKIETPRALFPVPPLTVGLYNYDVTRDGQRFLVVLPAIGSAPLHVVSNWQFDLRP